MEIHGHVDPEFRAVRDEFERNFNERGDLGASVCVIVDGQTVADLWSGVADPTTGAPWRKDTLTLLMSTTKGATSLCVHMLIDRGELDLDAPVAAYWPEFATNGKGGVTVRMLLNHQAGLPTLRETLVEGQFLDWEYMVNSLANETPFWEPGTSIGYHGFTFGWLVGELIRRVTGKMPGIFFRDEVASPLGLDLWIGIPASELHRVAPLRPDPDDFLTAVLASGEELGPHFRAVFANTGGYTMPNAWNTASYYQAELPASGGIGNGRSVAQLYAPLALGGSYNGVRLVSPEAIVRMQAIQSAIGSDQIFGMSSRFTLGFANFGGERGLPVTAFGHVGWGGSAGFADPGAGLAIGFVPNQMRDSERYPEMARFEALTDAAYRALGYRRGKSGIMIGPTSAVGASAR